MVVQLLDPMPFYLAGRGYSSSLARLLREAARSGLVLDFTRDLAFRQGRRSNITGVSGWSYTRSGTAYDLAGTTSFGANVARRTSAGLLVEAGATNLVSFSDLPIPGSGWSGSAVADSSGVSPAGGAAAKITTQQWVFQDVTTSNATFTFSVWLRNTAAPFTTGISIVNRSSTTLKATTACSVTADWQRFSVTGTTDGGLAGARVEISNRAGVNPTVGTEIWGAQLETGSVATSYIPTTSGAAARGADAVAVTNLGGFGLKNQGTLIAIARTYNGGAFDKGIASFDASESNGIRFGATVLASDGFNTIGTRSYSLNQYSRAALSWSGSTMDLSVDGQTVQSGAFDGLMGPDGNQINIGVRDLGGTRYLFGEATLIALLPRRVPGADLQAATA